MKTFNQLTTEIKSTYDAILENKKKQEKLTDLWVNEPDLLTRREKYKSIGDELHSAEVEALTLKLGYYILQNNARIALYNEVLPVFLDILTKYKGKPYGEKTRTRIADELEERTGARAYIGTSYGQSELRIYPPKEYGNTYSVTAGTMLDPDTKEYPLLLIENKIQVLPFEVFQIWYIKREYIEDIPAAIADMYALHKQAVALQAQLKDVCSKYNRYAVDGIDQLDCNKHIYGNIQTSRF